MTDSYRMKQLREAFRELRYEYSLHAVDQSILRHIARREIEEAVETGRIVQDYPHDKYGPTCLVEGITRAGRSLHILCTYPTRRKVKIITVYEPGTNPTTPGMHGGDDDEV